MNSQDRFAHLDWARIAAELDAEGHALLPQLLTADESRALAREAAAVPGLPPSVQAWRPVLYGRLLALANRWREHMGMQPALPGCFEDFMRTGRQAGQTQAQPHLLRVPEAGHAPLRSYSEGAAVFPLQLVLLLSRPGQDFEGGEFVMTEQRPRMQSRPMVLPLALGDAAIIATGPRPVRGAAGFYRVHLRHAISRVHRGEWLGLE
ncbi:prolyl 4-hydroxylase, partial [Pseudomonas monteilii]|nr:prolyl 4-hydroxylase [Pseudomonas monteilii]